MYRTALLSLVASGVLGVCVGALFIGGCGNLDSLLLSSFGQITRIAPSPLQAGIYTGVVACSDSSTIDGVSSSSSTEAELSIAIGPGGIPVSGRTVLRPGRTQTSQISGIDLLETITRVVTDANGVLVDGNVTVVANVDGPAPPAGDTRSSGTERTTFLVNPTNPLAIDYSFSLQFGSLDEGAEPVLDQQCSGTLTHITGSEGDVVCDDCSSSPDCLTCEEYADELMRLQRVLSTENVCQVLDYSIASIECACCEDSASVACDQLLIDFQAQRLQARCP